MATKQSQWLEDLDNLINTVPDIYLPAPVAERVMAQLEEIQEQVLEQIDLRSTEWES
jgi:hypothetical protein